MVLDVPVANRGEPAERPPSVGNHALTAVQQRPCLARRYARLLLRMWPTEADDLLVARLPRPDLSQRLLRRDRAALPAGRLAPAHVDARAQCSTEPLHQRVDQGPRQVTEPEEEDRNQDWPPRQPSREVGELDLQHLRRQPLGREEREPHHLRVTPRLTRLLT